MTHAPSPTGAIAVPLAAGSIPPPPTGPRPIEAIARDIAAAAALARPYLLPPPGTTLRGLLDELVAVVRP